MPRFWTVRLLSTLAVVELPYLSIHLQRNTAGTLRTVSCDLVTFLPVLMVARQPCLPL